MQLIYQSYMRLCVKLYGESRDLDITLATIIWMEVKQLKILVKS